MSILEFKNLSFLIMAKKKTTKKATKKVNKKPAQRCRCC